ncbi:DUF6838 family protein [Paraclostridium ghonii]|uniref:phage tail terminator family protein n=1 Tax=Paraclostridium ghonii TaxID=29358 RepID=UPI00202CE599|nr:hypothetical protein [Paeniclostridium ghonii]MCM0166998.1 hypothetical protein [Paeniclostridium ghonii]
MITYKDILYSITSLLNSKFKTDVFVETQEGIFDEECFYVQIMPIEKKVLTNTSNLRSLITSIKYFNDDKLKCYEVADILESLFDRKLRVKDRVLGISRVEPNIVNDGIGDMLDFLIYIDFAENSIKETENYELMKEINIKAERK